MKLSSKIYIHPLTLFFMMTAMLAGYFKYMIAIFTILIVHESGHYFVAKIFKRKIKEIVILPFGGLLKIDSIISSDIFEDLLIAIGGIGAQTVFGFILILLNKTGLLNTETFAFMSSFNIKIILFNMLPICPLDGYKIGKHFFELGIPFKKTFLLCSSVGVLIMIGIFAIDYKLVLDNPFVFLFLIYSTVLEMMNRRYLMLRFYIERMNFDIKYPIKNIKNISSMYKNKIHFIRGIRENVYLKHLFTQKRQ